jgi:amino acid adenylation domain-containing protein
MPIVVYMQKCCYAIIAFSAISYSGNFYTPIDTKQPEERINSILRTLDAKIALTNKANCLKLKSFFDGEIICIDDINKFDMPGPADINKSEILNIDPVYCLFTSGSTGVPKGVVIPHCAVIDYIDWLIETFDFNEKTIIANQAPFYFDNSVLDIYTTFAAGCTLYIIPDDYFSFPVKVIDYLNEKKINFIFWVPSVFVHFANFDVFKTKKPLFLKKILFCGEVMPNKHLNYWRRYLPECLYANLYGPTEITDVCSYYIIDREFLDHEPLPIGKACKNTDILILNEKNNKTIINELGELCVRGTCLALGYYRDREKTANAFIQNPLNDCYNELIYRTGDLAYWNENGELICAGRIDYQIKHLGYRIEPGEIETAVLGTGLVEMVCIVYDENRKEIVMFYQNNVDIDYIEFRRRLSIFIPKYMMPARCIRMDELPKNANGKIDRLKLKDNLPPPPPGNEVRKNSYQAVPSSKYQEAA